MGPTYGASGMFLRAPIFLAWGPLLEYWGQIFISAIYSRFIKQNMHLSYKFDDEIFFQELENIKRKEEKSQHGKEKVKKQIAQAHHAQAHEEEVFVTSCYAYKA